MNSEETLDKSALKAGMHEQTARKYLKSGRLPDEVKKPHTWKTRRDPFEEIWDEIKKYLELNKGLEAKTIFEDLQRLHPDIFKQGQLRTLQRKLKRWRALEGESKEIFFPQIHWPGELSQSDFTNMDDLGITIAKELFRHLIYHFVLTYSNWEAGSICYSESSESLSEGLQNALWKLGGVPRAHQTDRMTAAVNKPDNPEEFTKSYTELLAHYKLEGRKIQAARPNENGDIEQRHFRFKKAVDQQLMLRGSRDFQSIEEYKEFLEKLFKQLNSGRHARLQEELAVLRELPEGRLDSGKEYDVRVTKYSTITIQHNVYSVESRLIREMVKVYVNAEHLEVKYGQTLIERIPRLRGSGKSHIQYRHIIDSLLRKPGAFENYKYRDEMFPTTYFRACYDILKQQHSLQQAAKEYLKILNLAAKGSEDKVNQVLREHIEQGKEITISGIEQGSVLIEQEPVKDLVNIDMPSIILYDGLLAGKEVEPCRIN